MDEKKLSDERLTRWAEGTILPTTEQVVHDVQVMAGELRALRALHANRETRSMIAAVVLVAGVILAAIATLGDALLSAVK